MTTAHQKWMFVLAAIFFGFAGSSTTAQASNNVLWGGPTGRYSGAYPDINATYWIFHFKVPSTKNLSFRIKGEFPYARYFGLSVYDLETTDVQTSLLDAAIQPDAGSANPFVAGVDRASKARCFTAWVVPGGSKNASKNLLRLGSKLRYGTVMMRVYRPDKGRSLMGGVSVPIVEAFDDNTGKPIANTTFAVSGLLSAQIIGKAYATALTPFKSDLRATVDKRISFYRLHFHVAFPNGDANYLVSGLSLAKDDTVAVVRFRPPTFPDTYSGGGKFSGKEELRYWSINVAIDKWTQIVDGTNDEGLAPDKDGLTTIVFGPIDVKLAAEQAGLHWLPNGPQFGALSLWFRYMVPHKDFPIRLNRAPLFDPKKPLDPQRAENVLGEDAPTGRYYTTKGFLDALKNGGFRASFSRFGQGCPGAKGVVPQLSTIGGLPSIGNRIYAVRVSGMPAGVNGLYVGGATKTAWNGSALPLDLTKFGAKGCRLSVALDVMTPFTAGSSGMAVIKSPIPNSARLLGLNIFSQAFVTDPGAQNALRMSATGGNRFVLGR